MNEKLQAAISALPFFSGKEITFNTSLFMYHVKCEEENFMFLIKPTEDNSNTLCYSIFTSIDGIVKICAEENTIKISNFSIDSTEEKYDLPFYDKAFHESCSNLSFEIVEVLLEMSKLIDENLSA